MAPRDTTDLTADRDHVGGVRRDLPEVVDARGTLRDSVFLTEEDVSAVVVAVAPGPEAEDGLQPRAGTVDAVARYGVDLGELAERAGGPSFRGRAGQVVVADLPRAHAGAAGSLPWAGLPPRIVLLGVGSRTPAELRRAGAALARATRGLERVVSAATADETEAGTRAFVEGYLLAAYRTPRFGARPAARRGADRRRAGAADSSAGRHDEAGDAAPAEQLVLLGPDAERAIDRAHRAAAATWLARDLAATPSNVKNPAWLADRARALADAQGLETTVLGPRELAERGFAGILAVGAASVSPPRLVTVAYVPDALVADVTSDGVSGDVPGPGVGEVRHVVVVGKGITYDTGGLSIKPREAMVPMKTDMAGAAVALAAVLGAAQAQVPYRVTAVLPLAENHVGAASYRPGDVLRLFSGRTVEIANTDAEGRLVLAEALAYAAAELEPDVLVDVATLTGAASLGLGRVHGALYGTSDELVERVERAGAATGEPVWRMPLVEDYADALRSSVADLRHVPTDPPGGGSITAALFLREFTDGLPWVHLDIAGPARATTARHEVPEGATGYGARLLLRVLEDLHGTPGAESPAG